MAKKKAGPATGTKIEFVVAPLPYRRAALIAALIAAALGLPAIAVPAWMPPFVGAGVTCAALALALFAAWPAEKHARLLSMLAAVAVTMYAGAFVLQSVTGGQLDVESWMGPVPLGTISPLVTGGLLVAGLTLLWLPFATVERPHGAAGAGSLGAAVAVYGLGILLAHGYGWSWLIAATPAVHAPAGLALLVLGLGLSAAAGPDHVPLSALSGPSARARLLRALVGAVIAALVVDAGAFQLAPRTMSPADAALWSTLALAALVIAIATPLLAHIGGAVDGRAAEPEPPPEADEAAQLGSLAAQLPLYVWTTDAELRVTSVFGAQVAADDPRLGRWRGRTVYELFRSRKPEYPPIAAHLAALRGESGRYEYTYEGRRQECRVQPLRDEAGAVVGCLGLALDTTENA